MAAKLSGRLWLLFILMMGMFVVGGVAIVHVRSNDIRRLRNSLQAQQRIIVGMQARVIRQSVIRQAHDLLYLSRKRKVHALASGDLKELGSVEMDFGAFLEEHPDFHSITILDTDIGKAIEFERGPSGDALHRSTPISQAVREQIAETSLNLPEGSVRVSPLRVRQTALHARAPPAAMRFTALLYGDNHQAHGVIVVDFLAQQMLQEIDDLNHAQTGNLYLLDDQGHTIYSDATGSYTHLQSLAKKPYGNAVLAWSGSHATGQAILHGSLISQVLLCNPSHPCSKALASMVNYLPGASNWRLLRIIRKNDIQGLDLFDSFSRPFIILFLTLLTILAIGIFFGLRFFRTYRQLEIHTQQITKDNARIEAFVDNNPVGIFIRDTEGTYIYANAAKAARYGKSAQDLLGSSDREFHSPAEQQAIDAEDQEVFRTNSAHNFTHKVSLSQGDHYYESYKFPLVDPETGTVYIAAIETDITDKVVAETEARHHLETLHAIFDAAPDGILSLDAHGRIESVNRNASMLFGYAEPDMIGMEMASLFDKDTQNLFEKNVQSLIDTDTNDSAARADIDSCEARRADSKIFPVDLSLGKVEHDSRTRLVCIVRDITQRKDIETQLQRIQKMEAIGQLTGGMAHDFNNLLGVILGNLDILERHCDGNDIAMKRIYAARRAAERGADLNVRLLAFSRRQPLKPQPHDVNAILTEFCVILPQTLGPDIRIVKKLDTAIPKVMIDESGFESAMLNLAINARDAMPRGGTLTILSRVIEVGSEHAAVIGDEVPPGSYVLVSISDTGQGMNGTLLQRVFEPFFSTKPRGKGTGLGLPMVYGFIKQSRGYTTIYSEEGKGTTVNMHFPVMGVDSFKEPESPKHELADAQPPRTIEANRNLTILVVDDELGLLELTVLYLKEEGYRVLEAVDGTAAIEICQSEQRIDVLLTDVVMPGFMNGIELAHKARELHPEMAVLYMSGFPSSGLTLRTGLPADGPVLNKPFSRNALLEAIRHINVNQTK